MAGVETMGVEPEYPEVPLPSSPPERTPPQRPEPLMVPVVSVGGTDPWEQLAEQRRILVSGPLDRDAVTELSARLMALDGRSSRDVHIVINSPGGLLADVVPLLDVMDLMRARTNVTVIGSVLGTAVAVVACATGERRAAPNATFRLQLGPEGTTEGSASEIRREAEALEALRTRYTTTLAEATRMEVEQLSTETERSGFLTASQALERGIIDGVDTPSSSRSSRS